MSKLEIGELYDPGDLMFRTEVDTEMQTLITRDTTPLNIIFYHDNKPVGKLFVEDGKLNFEGKADKSAEVFFEGLIKRYKEVSDDK